MKELDFKEMSKITGGDIDWYGAVCGAWSAAWFYYDDVEIIEKAMRGYGCIQV